jgi:hypothetical protein
MMQCIVAPPDCHRCGHLESTTVAIGPHKQTHHRCLHPTGPHPMHDPCAWHSSPVVMRIDGNQVRR